MAPARQQHPFVTFRGRVERTRLDVVTFNFLYMDQKRGAPDRMPQLVACYRGSP